jgi:hypothetical protein
MAEKMDEDTRSKLYEQETSICFDELDGEAELYTASPRVFKLLANRGLSPYRVETMDGKPCDWFYSLPKWSVLIKPGQRMIRIGGSHRINSIAPGVAPTAMLSEVTERVDMKGQVS